MKRIFILLMILLLTIGVGSVLGAYTVTRNSPAMYNVATSTSITFNITCVGASANVNASIYYRTNNRSAPYSSSVSLGSIANNTPGTVAVSFADGDRVWWKASCYDLYGGNSVMNESVTLPATETLIDLAYDATKVQGVSGVVNYSGTYIYMTLGSDYNVTDGLVYLMNATLVGNDSMWNYSYPSSIQNDVNSTARVFDIDVAYYTLSFGVGELINMSLDTGVITASSFSGTINPADITDDNTYALVAGETFTGDLVLDGSLLNMTAITTLEINGSTGFTGTCDNSTSLTVVHGLITGCS